MKSRLLQLLPASDQKALQRDSVVTFLRATRELYRTGEQIDAVYFPLDCVISILVGAGAEDEKVEMATIGNEGVVGAYSILNGMRAIGDTVVQVPGDALRIDVAKYMIHLEKSEPFHNLMQRYLFALTRQILQAGACNRLHTMEARCARWLLMTHDRIDTDTFPLTQEFLAEMLGVRRATVNLAVGVLKTAGFIQYARGQVTVLDRAGLESASCPCYEIIRREFQGLKPE